MHGPERGQISSLQGAMLLVSTLAIAGHVILIPPVIAQAGRDAWASVLFGAGAAVGPAAVVGLLSARFPGRTLVQILADVFGRWLGKALALGYIGAFVIAAGFTQEYLNDFMNAAFLPRTPELALDLIFLALCAFAAYQGLEVFARVNQMLLPLIMVTGVVVSLMLGPVKDYRNLRPLLADGLGPALRGSALVLAVMAEVSLATMLQPYVRRCPWCAW